MLEEYFTNETKEWILGILQNGTDFGMMDEDLPPPRAKCSKGKCDFKTLIGIGKKVMKLDTLRVHFQNNRDAIWV